MTIGPDIVTTYTLQHLCFLFQNIGKKPKLFLNSSDLANYLNHLTMFYLILLVLFSHLKYYCCCISAVMLCDLQIAFNCFLLFAINF